MGPGRHLLMVMRAEGRLAGATASFTCDVVLGHGIRQPDQRIWTVRCTGRASRGNSLAASGAKHGAVAWADDRVDPRLAVTCQHVRDPARDADRGRRLASVEPRARPETVFDDDPDGCHRFRRLLCGGVLRPLWKCVHDGLACTHCRFGIVFGWAAAKLNARPAVGYGSPPLCCEQPRADHDGGCGWPLPPRLWA